MSRIYDNIELNFENGLRGILSNVGATRLMDDIRLHSELRTMRFKHDTLTVQCIIPKHSKPIIDEIDTLLGEYYGFTDEELDFIVNYDIKYRMGDELSVERGGS